MLKFCSWTARRNATIDSSRFVISPKNRSKETIAQPSLLRCRRFDGAAGLRNAPAASHFARASAAAQSVIKGHVNPPLRVL
jgi:hypothetical protein